MGGADRHPSRREIVSGATAALGLTMVLPAGADRAAAATESVTVEIESGKLRGTRENGAINFKGVPYAADTSGANRFMAPRPVANWSGTRDALGYGDRCPQVREYRTGAFGWLAPSEPFSENCCVLNIFTPRLDSGARRPVMFYIHGGGYITGAGSGPALEGSNLAKFGDVIVVTINHRLNVFGHTNLGHLDAELFGDAVNAGLLDIVAALQWVKKNISAFGGDPGNVTLFGQSGGGSKIVLLMAMPAAKGLFHRAVDMSGATGFSPSKVSATEPFTNEILKTLGIDRTNLRKLQELPIDALLKARAAAITALKSDGSRPVVDGRHLPAAPTSVEGLAIHANVPLMIGTVDTESTYYLAADMRNFTVTAEQVKARIKDQFKIDDTKALTIMDTYAKAEPKRTGADILIALATDVQFRNAIIRGAEAKANDQKAPVYLYNFTWYAPADGGVYRAPHTIDIPFVFGNTDKSVALTGSGAEPAEVARNVMSAFVAFARNGNPNNPHLPEWKPYDTTTRATMTFNVKCAVVSDFRGAERRASADLRLEANRRPLLKYSE
ncbi:carboxylesterase family protein [Bradyrhizobium sp. LHD-71]|uniref:carboxylesterase/lipase family protein n=1 Tax=Bradyrhizobium sp. LHD-71 TaxID=3072141 RepID=UPI00280C729A|nr:carboxylesterase family protein [Bradyrhizobium sp. LHD-71]MDQ8729758.1 carboxylesterase family protein [Bradyrhizobium sp. LHD-71]